MWVEKKRLATYAGEESPGSVGWGKVGHLHPGVSEGWEQKQDEVMT